MNMRDFEIERYFASREFSTPYLLCASDCESLSIGELCAFEPDGLEGLGRLGLGYTETRGEPGLRREIASLYETAEADDILVTAGGVEAIHVTMRALLGPGDRAVVIEPVYQCLAEIARGIGAEIEPWRLEAEEGWQPSLGRLEQLLEPGARVVVVNFPHNPTGSHPDIDTWRRLAEMVEAHGAVLVSDEAYRFNEYRDSDALPPASDLCERAVSMGLVSKAFGMPGLRIGWLASRDRGLLERAESAKDYTTICSSAPSEYLARLAIAHRQPILTRTRELMVQNLDLLRAFMARHTDLFQWTEPVAGPICFPRLMGGSEAAVEALCDAARSRAGVLVLPGRVFGYPEHLRFGFGRRNFGEALGNFEGFLNEWTPERP